MVYLEEFREHIKIRYYSEDKRSRKHIYSYAAAKNSWNCCERILLSEIERLKKEILELKNRIEVEE